MGQDILILRVFSRLGKPEITTNPDPTKPERIKIFPDGDTLVQLTDTGKCGLEFLVSSKILVAAGMWPSVSDQPRPPVNPKIRSDADYTRLTLKQHDPKALERILRSLHTGTLADDKHSVVL